MALGGTDFRLRSSTSLDPYAALEFTAATGYTAGQMMRLEDTVGVVIGTQVSGEQVVLVYQAARIVVPCVEITSGNLANFTVGSKVYFDVADAEVNATSGSNYLCGIVLETPSIGDETILIHLMGCLGIVT